MIISRFNDFLVESEGESDIFTEMDLCNISDLFLEIADYFGLKEIEKPKSYFGVGENCYWFELTTNGRFIGLIINAEYDIGMEIYKRIEEEFIPRLKKWRYELESENSFNLISPTTYETIKKLHYVFRKDLYEKD
jgi:hypothetical protein